MGSFSGRSRALAKPFYLGTWRLNITDHRMRYRIYEYMH